MIGKQGVEDAFGQDELSESYWIHRTRRNFPDHTPEQLGEDTFSLMAKRAISVIDKVIIEQMQGKVDTRENVWYIPASKEKLSSKPIRPMKG